MGKFLSIIVPVYKVEKYIDDCVQSILKQKGIDFELILVDDGSPDNCGTICDNYRLSDARVKVIHQENKGLSEARNAGVHASNSEYILFCDSDDFYLYDGFFHEICEKAKTNLPDIIMFRRCRVRGMSKEPEYYDDKKWADLNCEQYNGDLLMAMDKLGILEANANLKLLRREFIVDNGLYFKPNILSEDVEWSIRLWSQAERIEACNITGYCYRVRDDSISHSINNKIIADLIDTVTTHCTFLKNNTAINSNLRKALLGYLSYQYYIILGLVGMSSSINDVNDMLVRIQGYTWLADYANNDKTKKGRLLMKLFLNNNRIVSKILGIHARKVT